MCDNIIYLLICGRDIYYLLIAISLLFFYLNISRIIIEKLDLIFDLFSESLVVAGSVSPPTPTSIIHLMSIGFESLVLEMWLDLKSGKILLINFMNYQAEIIINFIDSYFINFIVFR